MEVVKEGTKLVLLALAAGQEIIPNYSPFLLTMLRGVKDPAALRAHHTPTDNKSGDPMCTCDI